MTKPRRGQFISKLGFQIAFLLAAVLLPLTLISMINAKAAVDQMNARSQAALTGETINASEGIVELIHKGRGIAAALSAIARPVIDDSAACSELMKGVMMAEPRFSFAAFVPSNGLITCSSAGAPINVSSNPLFPLSVEKKEPGFYINPDPGVTKSSIMGITHPILDEQADILGFITLSLPHSVLQDFSTGADTSEPTQLIIFDKDGTILAARNGLEDAAQDLPEGRSLKALSGDNAVSFSALSVSGSMSIFSIVPLVRGELYALGRWPSTEAAGAKSMLLPDYLSGPFLLPALIWTASLIAAWLSVERLVNRHIRKLSRSIKSFAGGSRSVGNVNVAGAPLEVREMAEAYLSMTETILRDEAEMEDTIHQKEVLLREVHHRVKNNLQLIASIMSMHLRRARTPETREVIKGLQDRVMSLATIHRELYQTVGVTDVHVDDLLGSIARQVCALASGPDREFKTTLNFDSFEMTPDQVVPLSLLLAEVLTNALKYAEPAPGKSLPDLDVSLSRFDAGSARLRVRNSIASAAPLREAPAGPSLGTQLVNAFAMQLGGRVERLVDADSYEVSVAFDLRPLTDAEERNWPQVDEVS